MNNKKSNYSSLVLIYKRQNTREFEVMVVVFHKDVCIRGFARAFFFSPILRMTRFLRQLSATVDFLKLKSSIDIQQEFI